MEWFCPGPEKRTKPFSERAMQLVFYTAYAASSTIEKSTPEKSGIGDNVSGVHGSSSSEQGMDFGLISLNQRRQHVVRAYQMRGQPPNEKTIQNPGKYEDLCRDIREIENLNIKEGFYFDFERQVGPFGFAHQFAMGQRGQDEPPSSYSFMAHHSSPLLGVLVSRISSSADSMMRWIYEGSIASMLVSYQGRQTPKGEETSFEAELVKPGKDWMATGKFAFQSTSQGSGPALCMSFAKTLTPNFVAGLEGMFFPGGSHTSITARYQRSLLPEAELKEANERHKAVVHYIEELGEETTVGELDMVKLCNALFEPREVFCFQAQSTPTYEFSYIRHISRLFTLVTSLSLVRQPQMNGSPYLNANWNLGMHYSADPSVFSTNISNMTDVSCTLVHAINDMLSLELCGNINYPKDAYKFGFGFSMRL